MIKYVIFSFLFFIANCDCENRNGYSKVKWNDISKKFTPTHMDLGEPELSIDFKCEFSKKNQLKLRGEILNEKMLLDSSERLNSPIVILECRDDGSIIDTLQITDNKGIFSIKTERNKLYFLVFKEINSNEGYRFDVDGFVGSVPK